MISSLQSSSWTLPNAGPLSEWPRILSEDLTDYRDDPLLLGVGDHCAPRALACWAARALLASRASRTSFPPWLTPHQVAAAGRLEEILDVYGGALLADAVGVGKSYIALAVAMARREPFALVVPAVLEDQWQTLLNEKHVAAPLISHESLSQRSRPPSPCPTARLFLVDEAHRFRNPDTRRYRALAKLLVGKTVLLITATPVHNRPADLLHLFRLFLRDHALASLGVASLCRAARSDVSGDVLTAVVPRLVVARSRNRVLSGYRAMGIEHYPARARGFVVRAGPASDDLLGPLVRAVDELRGEAASLFRLVLLSRLSSSIAAFKQSVERLETYLELALAAAAERRSLSRRDFRTLFPEAVDSFQLALFPVLLQEGSTSVRDDDLARVRSLRSLIPDSPDPKLAALSKLLENHERKTIVFTAARATARYLARHLARHASASVMGERSFLGMTRATRREVLRAFAPIAQRVAAPRAALQTNLLIATDLLSEGVNLQDAERVIHYDVPWTPARLAQRVGRIDRLGSLHPSIATVTFLPPPLLESALELERRLERKVWFQTLAGAAQIEALGGAADTVALDWCDRLAALASEAATSSEHAGVWSVVGGDESAVVLVVRLGLLVDAIVVDSSGARADPARATRLLELAAVAAPDAFPDRGALDRAIVQAAGLVRARLSMLADARWRAADRDRPGRRLVPWTLNAARQAARRGAARELARLDALTSRLTTGMTAGEELLLEELLERPAPLAVSDAVAWHESLPPVTAESDAPRAELMAALVIAARSR